MQALAGVGDKTLGQWEEPGNRGVYHVRRRLTDDERFGYGIVDVRDIRGTVEERERLLALVGYAPHLAPFVVIP